jgi:poly-gamma-glutamate synthesis protein (capsule biosynthesis protein)
MPVGAGRNQSEAHALRTVTVRGIRVGFLAYLGMFPPLLPILPQEPGVAMGYPADVRRRVAAARRLADVIVVSMHAGIEGATRPSPRQREIAHAAVDAGADLVIGHHPHVVQPVEHYRGKPVFYSLGNFISNQSSEHAIGASTALSTRDSAIVTLFLERHDRSIRPRFEITPIRTVNEIVRHPSGRVFRSIQPVAIADELDAIRTKVPPAPADDENARRLTARMEVIKKAILGDRTIDTIRFADH